MKWSLVYFFRFLSGGRRVQSEETKDVLYYYRRISTESRWKICALLTMSEEAGRSDLPYTLSLYISLFEHTSYRVVHRKCNCIQTEYIKI